MIHTTIKRGGGNEYLYNSCVIFIIYGLKQWPQIHIISTRFLLSIWNVWNVLCFKFKQFYVFSNSSWEDDKALCWSFSHSRDIPSGMVILLNRKSQMIIGQVMLIHAQTSMVRNFSLFIVAICVAFNYTIVLLGVSVCWYEMIFFVLKNCDESIDQLLVYNAPCSGCIFQFLYSPVV